MSFSLARPQKKTWKLNLTPLIDIIFLLVVFFMLTSQFELFSSLPLSVSTETKSTVTTSTDVRVNMIVQDNQNLQIDGKFYALEALPAVAENFSPATKISIEVMNKASAQAIVSVMEALKKAGLRDITLVDGDA